jgi:ABC-2 type transport system ATP-binding protein
MAILKRGEVIAKGSVREIMRSEDEIEVAAADMPRLLEALKSIEGVKNLASGSTITLTASNGVSPTYINEACAAKGIVLSHLVLKQKSLESTFMELTGGDTA